MKTTKIKFKIGEFSKLNQVTVKTLRHYEEIGLLRPNEIDEWTGYRFYDVGQMERMARILYLKMLGFSLEEIRDLFDEGLTAPPLEMIRAKAEAGHMELTRLQKRLAELEKLEKKLKNDKKMEQAFIKSLPAIIVASHRRVIGSYDDLFNLCPNVIGPEMARLGCTCPEPGYCYTIDHNKEYRECDIDIEYCEAVADAGVDSDLITFKHIDDVPVAVCMNHRGGYNSLPQTFARLYAYLEQNGFKIADSPRFCYIDGIWNKQTEEEWLTEIQVPATR